MTLEGRTVGSLVAQHRLQVDPEPGDLSVLRILANQAAVSLHTSEQYQAGLALHRRAQHLYDEATAQARNLADRTAELRQVEERLLLAHQRELIDGERHRIARELHDSVTQYVLSAGMAVEIARGEAEALGRPGPRSWAGWRPRRSCRRTPSTSCAGPSTRCTSRTATPSPRCPSCSTRSPTSTSRTSRCSCASRATWSGCPTTPTTRSPAPWGRRCSTWPPTRRRPGRSSGCATGPTRSPSRWPTTARATPRT